jgi:hypothetical protein
MEVAKVANHPDYEEAEKLNDLDYDAIKKVIHTLFDETHKFIKFNSLEDWFYNVVKYIRSDGDCWDLRNATYKNYKISIGICNSSYHYFYKYLQEELEYDSDSDIEENEDDKQYNNKKIVIDITVDVDDELFNFKLKSIKIEDFLALGHEGLEHSVRDDCEHKIIDWIKHMENTHPCKCCSNRLSGGKIFCARHIGLSIKPLVETKCCICLDDEKTECSIRTKCGHIFHESCFQRILIKKYIIDVSRDNLWARECPLCRTKLQGNDFKKIYETDKIFRKPEEVKELEKKPLKKVVKKIVNLDEDK